MLAMLRGCVGGLLRGAVQATACVPGACCHRRAPAAVPGAPTATTETGPAPTGAAAEPSGEEPSGGEPAASEGREGPAVASDLDAGGSVPPGPWRWRWVWGTPARPAGMALVAADGTLVLWSPGGFAAPGDASDGRPTPDVANALANLPGLSQAAAGAEDLLDELRRAREAAEETRRLLARAADMVDEEIERASDQAGDTSD